jgi:hypothetical protein
LWRIWSWKRGWGVTHCTWNDNILHDQIICNTGNRDMPIGHLIHGVSMGVRTFNVLLYEFWRLNYVVWGLFADRCMSLGCTSELLD